MPLYVIGLRIAAAVIKYPLPGAAIFCGQCHQDRFLAPVKVRRSHYWLAACLLRTSPHYSVPQTESMRTRSTSATRLAAARTSVMYAIRIIDLPQYQHLRPLATVAHVDHLWEDPCALVATPSVWPGAFQQANRYSQTNPPSREAIQGAGESRPPLPSQPMQQGPFREKV